MSTLVRYAKDTDIKAVADIENECFSVPWTIEGLKAYLPDDMHLLIVAENENSDIMGYIGLMYVLDEGYISNVAVSERYRRQGAADALIEFLVGASEDRKLSFLTLEVRESNAPARRLYEKNGFHIVGSRKNYYDKPKENAILMTRFLK